MRSHWGSRLGFILAAAGSAIGLGNIWKFPYITGENGGGAFVLTYLFTILVVGFPIFIAEIYIGAKAQSNAARAFDKVAGGKTPFKLSGYFGVISAFLILSFYSIVGGWILSFGGAAAMGDFSSMSGEQISHMLEQLLADPGRILLWHTIFMLVTACIVVGGVSKGIERWSKILMPAFFILLLGLLFFAMTLDGFGEAFAFLFEPNFHKLTGKSILDAVGHSFFTLSLGMGAMITYGSYLSSEKSLVRTAVTVTFLDTLMALVAGLVMFSVIFTFGMEPSSGPGLMFSTMPTLFNQMPGGQVLLIAFFTLVAFAALTSAISLLEVSVSFFVEEKGYTQKKATIILGSSVWALGILCGLSFNVLKGSGLDFFDFFDKITTNILMPLGGILTSLFFGWVVGEDAMARIVGGKGMWSKGLLWVTRVIAPLGVATVMFVGIRNWLFS